MDILPVTVCMFGHDVFVYQGVLDKLSKFFRRYLGMYAVIQCVCPQGMFNEVVGPTLPDIKARVGANYEEIARVLAARSAGLFLGSLAGGNGGGGGGGKGGSERLEVGMETGEDEERKRLG
jgi:hypothetical protein